MKNLSLIVSLLVLQFLINSCSKESNEKNVYTIEDYFEAYFPAEPTLHKRGEDDFQAFVIYNYYDEYEYISYVALYSILKKTPEDNKNFLYSLIYGMADKWNGDILKYELIEHEGNDEILYVTESERGYQLVYEFGVAAIKNNILYQWVVEEIDDMSKADKIFGEKVKYFKVLK